MVEKPAGVMRLVLVQRASSGAVALVARSGPIGGLRGANFGPGIEAFRFNAPDRLELTLSAPATCARGTTTHRFALRRSQWLVTGLDIDMPACAAGSVTRSVTLTLNFLTGTVHRTAFTRTGASRTQSTHGARPPFPLEQFPPQGPETAYVELQP